MRLRPWGLGIVGALVLFVAALWTMWAPTTAGPPTPTPTRPQERQALGRGIGGVASRSLGAEAPQGDDAALRRRVRGRVVDLEGAPVEFGTISAPCPSGDGSLSAVAGETARIGPGGEFVIPVCEGQTCVRLHHPTMVPAEPWLLGTGTSNQLVARPVEALGGRVVDSNGAPVVGATVSVIPPPGESDPEGLRPFTSSSTTTDGEGAFALFRIERPPCGPCEEMCRDAAEDDLFFWPRVLVVARAPGMQSAEIELELAEIEDPEPMELTLSDALSPIRGQLEVVYDSEGQGQAYVLARSEQRPYEQLRADVVDGRFEIDGVGAGTYMLRALQEGVELARIAGVRAGATVTLGGGHSRTGGSRGPSR